MIAKVTSGLLRVSGVSARSALQKMRIAPWQIVIVVSSFAGIGSGWAVLARQADIPSPFLAAVTMMLAMYAGWYAWAFFTHMVDSAFFGGHADYREMLDTFWMAYAFQCLAFLVFVEPLGWLWSWVGSYLTIVAWSVIGPRRFGMRTWQALVAVTLGMLLWLACLLAVTLAFQWNGMYQGIGAFLA